MPRNHLVLMTATITPQANQVNLALTDPAARLEDYRNALLFYVALLNRQVISGIVFVENSGFDLGRLKALFPDPRIEWLTYPDTPYPSEYHRGYGEFRLIDFAMQNASSIRCAAAELVVWKVTGRYIVENLQRVIRFAPKTFDLYCRSTRSWTEMSLMAWTRTGHEKLLRGVYSRFNSGKAPELILAPELSPARTHGCEFVREFTWPPVIIGRRGTDGGQFKGRFSAWRFRVAVLARILRNPLRYL